mmetsp:Transcript_41963/g.127089  ORF Transcript_41963/g.127089 Transcript_41963/m.127089 type:complete len:129 (-) Transcript_41963:30-416(-)
MRGVRRQELLLERTAAHGPRPARQVEGGAGKQSVGDGPGVEVSMLSEAAPDQAQPRFCWTAIPCTPSISSLGGRKAFSRACCKQPTTGGADAIATGASSAARGAPCLAISILAFANLPSSGKGGSSSR